MKVKKAIIFFIEDNNIDENTDFYKESNCFDMNDLKKHFKFQYLHFDRKGLFLREIETLIEISCEGQLDSFKIKKRFGDLNEIKT